MTGQSEIGHGCYFELITFYPDCSASPVAAAEILIFSGALPYLAALFCDSAVFAGLLTIFMFSDYSADADATAKFVDGFVPGGMLRTGAGWQDASQSQQM